jgi:hypothetical protein
MLASKGQAGKIGRQFWIPDHARCRLALAWEELVPSWKVFGDIGHIQHRESSGLLLMRVEATTIALGISSTTRLGGNRLFVESSSHLARTA